MAKNTIYSFLCAVLFSGYNPLFGSTDNHTDTADFDPQEVIMHHIADAHEWHLFDLKNENGTVTAYSIPLPVILFTEGNLDLFLSSAFHHGQSNVVRGDRTYALDHGHITELSGKKVLDFSLTKNATTLVVASLLLIFLFTVVAKSYRNGNLVPTGIAKFLEPIVVFVNEEIVRPNIGEHKYKKYAPYLLTLFFFIWTVNLMGLLPGGANATGNISVTLVLSFITLVVVNFSGNKNYWKHIFATPGVPWWLAPIMIPVELIGIISKPFSLMIRLFANITAGHIIVLSLVSLVFIFKSVVVGVPAVLLVLFISTLELLVAALQAYIFTLLTALFIGLAVEEHH